MAQRRPIRSGSQQVRPLRAVTGDAGAKSAALADRLLADITQLLVSEGSLESVVEAIADALREIVPHDTLTLYRADLPLRVLRPVLVRDRWAEQILAMGPLRFGMGITGTAAETGVPQMVNDALDDPRAEHIDDTPDEPEALIAIPLNARDELVGVLCLYRLGDGNVFTEEEFRLAIRFGGVAAFAIDNAEVRARLEAEVVTDRLTGLYNHRYFQERLAEELRTASLKRRRVTLLVYDIDDFSHVNSAYGHVVGDQVLQGVAAASKDVCRDGDVVCRVGGEEFAVILPGCSFAEGKVVGERLREAVAALTAIEGGGVTVSVGVAERPAHATAARDLTACADSALQQAKSAGKDRVVVWSHGSANGSGPPRTAAASRRIRPADLALGDELRSVAHLKMLQSLSQKLNRLNDVRRIGETITAELRSLIDYHNCRVHLLQHGGELLVPVAFRGELLEYQGETFDALVTKMGEGITGQVAETGQSFYTPNANLCEFAVLIPGTQDVDESILCVPMRYGDQVIGTVTLSKLGIDQFDREDLRLLEVLASHAAVAFENARLFQNERESAEISGALLELSQALTLARETDDVIDRALGAIPSLVSASAVAAWIRDPDTGDIRMIRQQGFERIYSGTVPEAATIPAAIAEPFTMSEESPFVLPASVVREVPEEFLWMDEARALLVAPLRWEPDGRGSIIALGAEPTSTFSDRDLRLAQGLADLTSLALGNARIHLSNGQRSAI